MIRKTLLLVLLALCAAPAPAQTQWVAHRSHGGTDAAFRPSAAHPGLGLPAEPILQTVTRLSDTTAALLYSYPTTHDTVLHHNQFCNPAVDLDSLQALYPRTRFIGYKSNPRRRPSRPAEDGFWAATDTPGGGGTPGPWVLGIGVMAICVWLAYRLFAAEMAKAVSK